MYSAIYGEYEVALRVPALRASVKFVCRVRYIYDENEVALRTGTFRASVNFVCILLDFIG